MNHAIKLGRISSQTSILSSSSSSLSSITSKKGVGSVRLVQVNSGNKDPNNSNFKNMDKSSKNPDEEKKNMNVMEDSFGEGYSTRSDDEGFGGIYGGNDENSIEGNAEMKITQNPGIQDSNQGSHVKEKEKARNQTQAH